MKAEKFKTLCRRILNLEANGWKAEMPDDWKIMVFTRHGIEPLDSWSDEPDNKQILLCGKSVNEEPLWHSPDEEIDESRGPVIVLNGDASCCTVFLHMLKEQWERDIYLKHMVAWFYLEDIMPDNIMFGKTNATNSKYYAIRK